jgi:hypothetical protein
VAARSFSEVYLLQMSRSLRAFLFRGGMNGSEDGVERKTAGRKSFGGRWGSLVSSVGSGGDPGKADDRVRIGFLACGVAVERVEPPGLPPVIVRLKMGRLGFEPRLKGL